jgi:hypothetical protein
MKKLLYCPAFSGIAVKGELNEDNQRLLSRLRCKSWSCDFCAAGNRARWQAFLLDVLPAISEIWSFHTLTLPDWLRKRADFSPEDKTIASLALIRGNWDKLMKRLKRQVGAAQYFRVFEKHGDGVLHVHFLLSHTIPHDELKKVTPKPSKKNPEPEPYYYWRWLKDNAPECGFGYMTASENLIDPQKAVGYTTKYMTKEDLYIGEMLGKYRVRRFQSSQGIGSQDDWGRGEDFWEVKSFVEQDAIEQESYYDLNLKTIIKESMLGKQGEYPPLDEYKLSDEERKRRKGLVD